MYTFVRVAPFMKGSSLYEVYNYNNHYVTTIVVGYCELNKIYYYTEYRGVNKGVFIGTTDEFCSVLHAFTQFFEMLDYTDIISDNKTYLKYKDELPLISLNKLYLYDNSGRISCEREYIIIPEEDWLEDLIRCGAINGTQFLLEEPDDYFDENELFIDLSENPYYCDGDKVGGFYLSINDWIEIEKRASAYDFNYRRNHPCSMAQSSK